MSEETLERVYTINLGKVWLSPNNQRAKRAINMIKEFATRHMKSENVKIEEDVSHLVWARGIRHPPRKIRVKLTKDDDGNILISKYEEEKKVEEKSKGKKTEKKIEKKEEKKVEETPKETKAETKVEVKPKEKKVEKKVEEKPAEKKTEKTKEKKAEEKPKESKSDKKTKKD
ncbi:50S ribosomal protein L31e [Candidatus Pacearchaeota archaeon]|nr:50S ribosomal protein L31e [Candidatus Pacearchaeota archaeon]